MNLGQRGSRATVPNEMKNRGEFLRRGLEGSFRDRLLILLVQMFGLGIRRDGFAMDVVARSAEMIDPLVAAEGGVTRIRRPGVFRRLHFLRLRDIVFVLIIGISRIVQASVSGRRPAKLGVARAGVKISSLAHPE
jgi:hypothetical protein